ncbi:MAG: septal ring lytic transglycosylase RlpA family protein [Candidatus Eisenbacteria bacterium]|uniref:Probable endolytic peptidoglycan transglycosylase RlpA n=1 Tax=Eiseniibacteriota bacterium TaxID=2212470 RepID=A0A538U9E9_UNCEI|nr:MAG: septal ring lytic transglycosylase RlpA family protein [Candidatus Eisenbacteria bacterium]
MPRLDRLSIALALFLIVASVTPTHAGARVTRAERGYASYYGQGFDSLKTASGERFDIRRMTAAHRTLPFGTRLRVTNLRNGLTAIVRVNDRGPFVKGRVVDVSYAAARRLRMIDHGVERVRLEVLPKTAPSS